MSKQECFDWVKLFASCFGGAILFDIGGSLYGVLRAGLFGGSPTIPSSMMAFGFAFGGLIYLNSKIRRKPT